jgi:hypothetical protein
MSEVVIEVDGQREDVSGLWVHFQELTRAPAFQYRILVPSAYVRPVFDPLSLTGPDKPLLGYINELVGEMGTFIVDGYIRNIAKVMRVETKRYRWVIAGVDCIREVPEGIELLGKALRFDPSLYM